MRGKKPRKEKVAEEEKNAWADMFRNDIRVIVGTSSVEIIGWISGVKQSRRSGGQGYGDRAMFTVYGHPRSEKLRRYILLPNVLIIIIKS